MRTEEQKQKETEEGVLKQEPEEAVLWGENDGAGGWKRTQHGESTRPFFIHTPLRPRRSSEARRAPGKPSSRRRLRIFPPPAIADVVIIVLDASGTREAAGPVGARRRTECITF